MKKSLIIGIILAVAITAMGCSTKKNEGKNTDNQTQSQTQNQGQSQTQNKTEDNKQNKTDTTQKTFTLEELKKYDGQNGNKAYVAVDGKVYDVTNAEEWRNGKHKGGVTAGKDLSNEINNSPHGKDVLKDLPVVGVLK
ncbi:Predicted heme/steroid binding protein [Clostridium cavendishii DSM 21758]|uniref:Predicted heme/steroid binding protein n=1 Tax=Clostridium cavendishii DSM 21758 TaxID=1121302 RepID=A0A1M6J6B0_9CLOT|nr:cytochrome b5 domain-containing protein [Clostridium cavendishii]SHJ42191.1 Predicted heme/steroid binding protein [Clostridium cavendishii DSM 21758]